MTGKNKEQTEKKDQQKHLIVEMTTEKIYSPKVNNFTIDNNCKEAYRTSRE